VSDQPAVHPRRRSFLAGVLGAAVMALVIWKDGHFGELLVEELPRFGVALVAHLGIGGAFGIVYGFAFDAVHRAGWRAGMVVGAAHGLLAVLVLSIAPSGHALHHAGSLTWAGAAFIVGLHVLFGLLVGVLYEPRAEVPERETTLSEIEPGTGSPVS
jgi:Na+/proline symporter